MHGGPRGARPPPQTAFERHARVDGLAITYPPSTTPPAPRDSARFVDSPAAIRSAALRLLASSFLFAVMAAATKAATVRLPGPEVAMVRFLVGIVLAMGVVAIGAAQLRPRRWGWLTSRGVFGGSAVVAYFIAIQTVPVGVATLLNQTQPVYTMLFSWWLLAERPRHGALLALGLTLAGVGVIVVGQHPEGVTLHGSRGELYGVFSAIASGVAVASIRGARRPRPDGPPPETSWSVFLAFSLLGAVVTVPFVVPPFGTWVAPTTHEWWLLGLVGLVSSVAQVIMTSSLRQLTGVQSGIIAQLTVPMTVALAFLFLNEHLAAAFFIGGALTVGGVALAILTAAPKPGAIVGK